MLNIGQIRFLEEQVRHILRPVVRHQIPLQKRKLLAELLRKIIHLEDVRKGYIALEVRRLRSDVSFESELQTIFPNLEVCDINAMNQALIDTRYIFLCDHFPVLGDIALDFFDHLNRLGPESCSRDVRNFVRLFVEYYIRLIMNEPDTLLFEAGGECLFGTALDQADEAVIEQFGYIYEGAIRSLIALYLESKQLM